jgi:ribosomal protein S18 acetylase RimI-like enzyme
MSIQIRLAELHDVECLAKWAQAMALETEGKILPDASIVPGVAAGLADPQVARYYVAEIDGESVGTLMLTTEWSDWRNGVWLWIQSVYVHPEHRRKGVYRALYAHVQSMANQDATICGIRLYVEKENQSAQQTYKSLGMQDAHYLIFEQSMRE